MTNVVAKAWSLTQEYDDRLYSYPVGHAPSPPADTIWVAQDRAAFEAQFGVIPVVPNVCIFGANQYGGSGRHAANGTWVMYVTSLGTGNSGTFNNAERTGSGTLIWCFLATLPLSGNSRVIIPLVSGLPNFANAATNVGIPYITYAGQCAPSPGLYLQDWRLYHGVLNSNVDLHHVSMHLPILQSATGYAAQITMETCNGQRVLIVNGLVAWAQDECWAFGVNQTNKGTYIGFWQCLAMEGIGSYWSAGTYSQWPGTNNTNNTGHGPFADMDSGSTCQYISFARMVFAYNYQRCPYAGIGGPFHYANNMVIGHGLWHQADYQIAAAGRVNHEMNISAYTPNISNSLPIYYFGGNNGQVYVGSGGQNNNRQLYPPWAETNYGQGATVAARIPEAWPAGYVAEYIGVAGDGSTAAAVTLANKLIAVCGARPNDRLPTISRCATLMTNLVARNAQAYGAPLVGINTALLTRVSEVYPTSVAQNTIADPYVPQAEWGGRSVPTLANNRDVPYASGTFTDGTSRIGYTRLEEFIYELHLALVS